MADVTVQSYFEELVPQQYAAALVAAPADVAAQPPLSAVFVVSGEGGSSYSLRSAGGQLEVLPGDTIDAPDLRVLMSYDAWRTLAEDGAADTFVDFVQRGKVLVVKNLKGTVNLDLTRSDGSAWESTMIFGDQAEPVLTMRMTADDYKAMLDGDLNGQMAFMTGKLKFEGSLPLLMQIGALAS